MMRGQGWRPDSLGGAVLGGRSRLIACSVSEWLNQAKPVVATRLDLQDRDRVTRAVDWLGGVADVER